MIQNSQLHSSAKQAYNLPKISTPAKHEEKCTTSHYQSPRVSKHLIFSFQKETTTHRVTSKHTHTQPLERRENQPCAHNHLERRENQPCLPSRLFEKEQLLDLGLEAEDGARHAILHLGIQIGVLSVSPLLYLDAQPTGKQVVTIICEEMRACPLMTSAFLARGCQSWGNEICHDLSSENRFDTLIVSPMTPFKQGLLLNRLTKGPGSWNLLPLGTHAARFNIS